MDKNYHSLSSLFKQLGLPSSESDIIAFINIHQTNSTERIDALSFWSDSQSIFLKECLENDSDWSEIVDELDTMLRANQFPSPELNPGVQNIIAITLKILILIGGIFCFVRGHYLLSFSSILVFLISSLPQVLSRKYKLKIPPEFDFLAVLFIFITLYLGNIQNFYEKFWWWDIFLHTSSGFMLGIVGFLMIFILNERPDISLDIKPNFMAIFAFTFAVSLGVVWEIFEFFMDQLFNMNMQGSGLVDTMWDLIVDSIGALAISVLGAIYYKRMNHESFLEKWLDNFIRSNPKLFKRVT